MFDPQTLEFQGFRLEGGEYQPIEPNAQGYLWSEQLGLYLGLHEEFVRFFTLTGELVPTPEENSAQLEEDVMRLEENLMRLEQRVALG